MSSAENLDNMFWWIGVGFLLWSFLFHVRNILRCTFWGYICLLLWLFVCEGLGERLWPTKSSFSNVRAEIKETSGWRDDMEFCTTSHVSSVSSLRKTRFPLWTFSIFLRSAMHAGTLVPLWPSLHSFWCLKLESSCRKSAGFFLPMGWPLVQGPTAPFWSFWWNVSTGWIRERSKMLGKPLEKRNIAHLYCHRQPMLRARNQSYAGPA